MNKIFNLGLLILSTSFNAISVNEQQFIYQYQVIGETKRSEDVVELYYVKEKLIDIYESFFIDIDPSLITDALKENLSLFKCNENTNVYFRNGLLLLIIGNGNGLSIKGSLRSSLCDDTTIREKFFILDKDIIYL